MWEEVTMIVFYHNTGKPNTNALVVQSTKKNFDNSLKLILQHDFFSNSL